MQAIKFELIQVLVVLSRIHDPIDGMDLSAQPVIEDHITQLLSNSGQLKPGYKLNSFKSIKNMCTDQMVTFLSLRLSL